MTFTDTNNTIGFDRRRFCPADRLVQAVVPARSPCITMKSGVWRCSEARMIAQLGYENGQSAYDAIGNRHPMKLDPVNPTLIDAQFNSRRRRRRVRQRNERRTFGRVSQPAEWASAPPIIQRMPTERNLSTLRFPVWAVTFTDCNAR